VTLRACSAEATSAFEGSDRDTFLNIHTCLKLGRRVQCNAAGFLFVKRLEEVVVWAVTSYSIQQIRLECSLWVNPYRDSYRMSLKAVLMRWKLSSISVYTRAGTLIVATIYLQLIQNRYMFRSFTVL